MAVLVAVEPERRCLLPVDVEVRRHRQTLDTHPEAFAGDRCWYRPPRFKPRDRPHDCRSHRDTLLFKPRGRLGRQRVRRHFPILKKDLSRPSHVHPYEFAMRGLGVTERGDDTESLASLLVAYLHHCAVLARRVLAKRNGDDRLTVDRKALSASTAEFALVEVRHHHRHISCSYMPH